MQSCTSNPSTQNNGVTLPNWFWYGSIGTEMVPFNFDLALLFLAPAMAVTVADLLEVETNSSSDANSAAINASIISLANDTVVLASNDVSMTDLAPIMPINTSDKVTASMVSASTNSTPIQIQHIDRNWANFTLVNLSVEDPNKVDFSLEVDPFHFTSEPTFAPSSHPSDEPSLLPSSRPTPRPTIWRETSEPRNADESYFDYNPKKNSRYGPGQKEIYEVKKYGSTKIIYENNKWEKVKDSPEEMYWRPLQKDIKFDLSKNSCSSKDSRFQSPIDIWPSDYAVCEEHHQIRHRPGDFRIDGNFIEKQILPSKLRLVFPRRVGEEPDPPFAVRNTCANVYLHLHL